MPLEVLTLSKQNDIRILRRECRGSVHEFAETQTPSDFAGVTPAIVATGKHLDVRIGETADFERQVETVVSRQRGPETLIDGELVRGSADSASLGTTTVRGFVLL